MPDLSILDGTGRSRLYTINFRWNGSSGGIERQEFPFFRARDSLHACQFANCTGRSEFGASTVAAAVESLT